MDAPKGMAISAGKLYVADITKVRVVDLASGKLVSTHRRCRTPSSSTT